MSYCSLLKLFFIVTILFLIQGCASSAPLSLQVHEQEGQTTLYSSGKPIVISSKTVMVAATTTEKGLTVEDEYLAVSLIFVNTTDETINVTPDGIEAFGSEGGRLEVLSFRQQELAVEQAHKRHRIALALQGFGAATSQSTGSYSGTVDGEIYSGTVSYPTENVEKQKAVQNDIAQMKADIRNEKANYLKRQTLFPGKEYFGSIWIKKPASFETPYSLVLIVSIENETHRFKIDIHKVDAL